MVEINIWNDNTERLTSIYEDYPTHPYCSLERSKWSYSKQCKSSMRAFSIIPIEMMEMLPNGLLLGHIKLLWRISLNYFSYKTRIPSYFEYRFGIDVNAELIFLTDNKFIFYDGAESIFKMTEKGSYEFDKYAPWLELSEIKSKYRNTGYYSFSLTELTQMLGDNSVYEIELFLIDNQIKESLKRNHFGVHRNSYLDLYKLNIKRDTHLAFKNLCYVIAFDLAGLNTNSSKRKRIETYEIKMPSLILSWFEEIVTKNSYKNEDIALISNEIWSEYSLLFNGSAIKNRVTLLTELNNLIYNTEE